MYVFQAFTPLQIDIPNRDYPNVPAYSGSTPATAVDLIKVSAMSWLSQAFQKPLAKVCRELWKDGCGAKVAIDGCWSLKTSIMKTSSFKSAIMGRYLMRSNTTNLKPTWDPASEASTEEGRRFSLTWAHSCPIGSWTTIRINFLYLGKVKKMHEITIAGLRFLITPTVYNIF